MNVKSPASSISNYVTREKFTNVILTSLTNIYVGTATQLSS